MRDNVNQRVPFDGQIVTVRTRDALLYAERLWQQRGKHHKRIRLAQGSFEPVTSYSGPTHHGDGVFDARTTGVGLTASETVSLARAMADSGIAPYIRDARDGMPPHIHGIVIDDPEADPSAKRQVADWDKGYNGLTSRAKDRTTYRPKRKIRFSWRQGKPVPR
jgi:hypothetical protein